MDDAPSRSFPLYAQVLLAVVCGAALGAAFGQSPYPGGLRNEHLGRFGILIIAMLKTLAVPLIFFAIVDAFLRTEIPFRQGTKLLAICLVNVSVAMAIGLFIMNVWRPGLAWQGHVHELLDVLPDATGAGPMSLGSPGEVLHRLERVAAWLSINNVLGVVLGALALGVALRRLRGAMSVEGPMRVVAHGVGRIYGVLVGLLRWIIRLIPFAVFGVMAHVVGRAGLEVFSVLWVFLAAIMLGLGLHAFVYYPSVAWLIGKKPPDVYLGKGADAIVTAVSCNSSLATVPVTLRCLDRMQVSQQSSRLAACVGTNLNNDGITLYEAMAALFLAQALGFDLSLGDQWLIVAASIMAGAGVAGIPEAGLVVLPLVLSAARLPDEVIVAAIPLIMAVDWILARARSGVNVMSDMVVAILLDAGRTKKGEASAVGKKTVVLSHPRKEDLEGEAGSAESARLGP